MPNVDQDILSLNSKLYGILQGKEVYTFTLSSEAVTIEITNLGCCITAIYTPARNGVKKNIVAGFKELKEYEINRDYFGCILGRYANRIAGGTFFLDEKEVSLSVNDGENHLHGGVEGFNKKIWEVCSFTRHNDHLCLVLEYLSIDGEEGYPGNLRVQVKYIFNNKNQLCIEYFAETDKATPVSLSNHSYFNLTGFETPLVTSHTLQITAMNYTEKNEYNLPTGNIVAVSGTSLDFLQPKKIGEYIAEVPNNNGFDHNYILNNHDPGVVVLAAQLKEASTGRTLKIFTDQQAMQLYTANFWDGTILGQQGQYYQKNGAVALETQAFPDSPNQPSFPNTILYPGETYFATTVYEFGVE